MADEIRVARASSGPTADAVLTGMRLTDQIVLVTGATSGLGEETARALAAGGAHVLATGRTLSGARQAAERIGLAHPDARVTPIELELGSLASVRRCVSEVLARHPILHAVIANAGVMAVPKSRTEDGLETHFGVNHLGHFALVTGLLPALVAGAPSRVVVLSSAGHRWGDVDLDDHNLDRHPYRPFGAYGASKTANVLFVVELDRRMQNQGVRAYAVHPGGVSTRLTRHLSEAVLEKLGRGQAAQNTRTGSIQEGAATTVWAATSPDLSEIGGVYLEGCSVASVTPPEASHGVRDFAVDPDRARRLWSLSEQLIAAVR